MGRSSDGGGYMETRDGRDGGSLVEAEYSLQREDASKWGVCCNGDILSETLEPWRWYGEGMGASGIVQG